MENWRDSFKDSGSSRQKLDHKRVKIKEDENDGSLSFVYYDSTTKSDVTIESPINCAILGSAMNISAFDNQLRKSYKSNYIFDTKANATQIYKPDGKAMFDKPTNYQLAKSQLVEIMGAAVKPKFVWFVFNLDNSEIYAIEGNPTISIDIKNKINDGISNVAKFAALPSSYKKGDERFGKKTIESLGSLANKNNPKFPWFDTDGIVSDDVADKSGLIKAKIDFDAYKKSVTPIVETEEKGENTTYAPKEESHIDGLMKRTRVENTPDLEPSSVEDDDLPF